jgi:hypothetical protein
MLTRMTERDWAVALEVFQAARSRRGDKGRDDRRFLEALHCFTVHNITWRALPAECIAPGSLDNRLRYAARLKVWSSHASRLSSGLRWPFFSISHSAL